MKIVDRKQIESHYGSYVRCVRKDNGEIYTGHIEPYYNNGVQTYGAATLFTDSIGSYSSSDPKMCLGYSYNRRIAYFHNDWVKAFYIEVLEK